MNYNYHTHTPYSRHASGTEEDYIKRAIECGIEYMGFSDHSPFSFPFDYESNFRVPLNKAEEYMIKLDGLRRKYKNKIDIKIGFEMEYYPGYFDQMVDTVKKVGCEYLILGQHFIYDEYPNGIRTIEKNSSEQHFKEYISCIISAIKSDVFSYIAHPDIFNYTGNFLAYVDGVRKLCRASNEYNIPLEVNFLGIRENRLYPNEDFWKIAGEEKAPVTFGFDAHDTMSAYDGESLLKAEQLVSRYKLNYVGKPKIIELN